MSKGVRMDLDYPKRFVGPGPDGKTPDDEAISWAVIVTAMGTGSLSVSDARIWSRIQEKLTDENGKPKSGYIELSDEQFDWLYQRLSGAQYAPNFAGVVAFMMDEWERWKLKKETVNGEPGKRAKNRVGVP